MPRTGLALIDSTSPPRPKTVRRQPTSLRCCRRCSPSGFKLTFHRDTRELSIFELQLARADGVLGPKMKKNECVPDLNAPPSAPGGPPRCGTISNGFGRLTLIAQPISVMAQFLAPSVNRVVVDRTRLTGNYDVDLTWTPDRLPPRPPGAPADQPIRVNGEDIDPNGPSIFTAVREQLGLKLESAKGLCRCWPSITSSSRRPINVLLGPWSLATVVLRCLSRPSFFAT